MNSLDQAKEFFEQTVQRMQADLISYSGRPSSNPKAVETRKTNINNLVEYYIQSEETRSDQDMQLLELQFNIGRQQESITKLLYLCKLHGINANILNYLTMDDLKAMATIKLPFTTTLQETTRKNIDLDRDALVAPYISKYYNALALANYAQKTK